MLNRLHEYYLLTRLDKPIGIFLLLWPTLWAILIASDGKPDVHIVLVFVAGVILMRSAGCVINDIADRGFDPHVARTRNRPIAAGRVSLTEAMVLFLVLVFSAFLLVLTLDYFTIKLSIVAVLLATSYPFMKRYTYIPQLFLGMAFGWAVPMAFAAQTGSLPTVAWLLFIVTVLWAVAYDTMYAMVDRDDDLRVGVKSTAILFGDFDRTIIAIIQVIVLSVLVVTGIQINLGFYYYLGILGAAIFAIYQQYLIKSRDKTLCFRAFLNNNWFGFVIFIGILLNYYVH
ncbi:MAG: 4-hydroxybenzoate octaprenyltransferase [Gammaproteobacteria bacterium]